MPAASASSRRPWMFLWAVSGFGTLTLELVWMREMALWSGNTVTASTLVTAVFFACAACGNLLGARLMRRQAPPLRCYATFEMLAAVSALLCLVLSRNLWADEDVLPRGWWLRVAMALLLAGPASFCSGVAFPSLAESFVKSPQERVASGASFYALNLLGAALGVIAGGVFLPWRLGIQNAFYVATAAQLLGGMTAWRMAGRAAPVAPLEKPVPGTGSTMRGWVLLFASGLLSLATQALMMLWVRQILEGSLYVMSAVLAVSVAGLGLGALIAGWMRRRGHSPPSLLRVFGSFAALGLFVLPVIGTRLSVSDMSLTAATPMGLTLQSLTMCAVVLMPIVVCLGAVFPLAWEITGLSQESEGCILGRALALNKTGAAAGVTLGLFALMPMAGLAGATHIIAWGYAWIAGASLRPSWRWLVAVILSGLWLTFAPLPAPGITADLKLIASQSGAYGPVSVVEDKQTGSRQILLNSRQRLSGTQRALASQQHQSWAPLLLCPRPERVLTIGMAAGISSDAVLDFPVSQLDAVELVPEVVAAAREHFSTWNKRLFNDPRARIITDDGRQVLARATGPYDAILCDLFFPAEEATAHLYTREFFELAHSKLSKDGVFCLWLPCYQNSAATADLVTRTFLRVFPHAVLLRASFDPMQPVAGLVGSARPMNVSVSALQLRIEAAGLTGRSPFLKSGRYAQMLLLGDLCAANPPFDGLPLITDDHPLFAWLGPAVHAREQGLYGVRFLNWAGRRFPEPSFPSCELPASEAENLLQSIRAANHYLATAIAATVLPDDTRPAPIRDEQVRQSLSRARALSPALCLDLDDLGR